MTAATRRRAIFPAMARSSALLALLVALATALLAPALATAQEEGPVCPAEIDGQALETTAPGAGDDVQSLRCRYPSDGERSALRLVVRYNAPGDEPTLIGGCGGEPRRNEEGRKINGFVFSEVGSARVAWEIGNTNRIFNELAVVAAAEGFLSTFEDLAIPCPDPGEQPDDQADIAAACAEQFDGLEARIRSPITNRDDVGGVRCVYAGTDARSEVQFVATLNPPGVEPTLANGCGLPSRSSERDGVISGTVFSASNMARVRYSIVDSSLEFDETAAAAEAAALLTRIESDGQLCDTAGTATTEPPATTEAPATSAPGDTTTIPPTTANVPTTAAPVAGPDSDDDGGSGLVLPIIAGSLAVAAAAGAFVWWRRRQMSAPAAAAPAAPPAQPRPPRNPNDPGDTITQPPPPPRE